MYNERKRNVSKLPLIGLVLIITVIAAIGSYNFFTKNKINGITGDDWIIKEKDNIDTVDIFTENLDNTITLYVSGLTEKEAFINDLTRMKKEWLLISKDHDNFIENNKVTPSSHSIASKTGYEACKNYYTEIGELIDELILRKDESIQYVSYAYLAHQQSIVKEYTTFYLCYNIASGIYDNLGDYVLDVEEETSSN